MKKTSHASEDSLKNPDTLTILIFFFISALLAGFFGAATNDVVFDILKNYQGLLTGFGAITAALIAYKAAMIKVYQDAEHKEKDEQRHYIARNLHAIRVARFNIHRIATLIGNMTREDKLFLSEAQKYWNAIPPIPSGGLVECLNNAAELDPKVLVQLHRLYSTLEISGRITKSYDDADGNLVLRDKSGWQVGNIKVLDENLRFSYDLCRVIISLGRNVVGSEYMLTDEEFDAATKDVDRVESIPAEIPRAPKKAER